jgi:hypothetical protein
VGLLLVVTSVASANDNARREITVRWYNAVGVSIGQLSTAQQIARDLLRRAGFEPLWRTCRGARGPSRKASDACNEPLRPNELIVRVVATPPDANHEWVDSLGFSYVDTAARAGTLSTVFADHVAVLANAAGMDPGVLLGRAAAHEIGHLLIGGTTHTATGLMQAHWSVASLKRDSTLAWLFSEAATVQMQHGFLARFELRSTAPTIVAEATELAWGNASSP